MWNVVNNADSLEGSFTSSYKEVNGQGYFGGLEKWIKVSMEVSRCFRAGTQLGAFPNLEHWFSSPKRLGRAVERSDQAQALPRLGNLVLKARQLWNFTLLKYTRKA